MKAISSSALHKKKLGDWVVNPFIGCEHGCLHCYCPAMPGVRFNNGGRDQQEWGEYLIPKHGIVESMRRELRSFTPDKAKRTTWGDGWLLMSFLTDCYTPAEAKLRLTRQCLELLLDAGHKVRVLTRSALAERDFDLLRAYPGRVLFGTSLPHMNDALARVLEPRATAPSRRLAMLTKARDVGISTFVAIAPFLPGHSTVDLESLVQRVAPSVTHEMFCEVLNPKGSNIQMMVDALAGSFPEHRRSLEQYTPPKWAVHTWDILSAGTRLSNSWVPWPDTGKGWKKHLSVEQTRVLTGWLPVGA